MLTLQRWEHEGKLSVNWNARLHWFVVLWFGGALFLVSLWQREVLDRITANHNSKP